MARMQIGQLREQVTLQQPVAGESNLDGGFDSVWTNVATVRARIEPLGGSEQLQALALEGVIDYRVTLRYRGDLAADWRLVWRQNPSAPEADPILAVAGAPINPDRRRQWTEVLCKQGVAA